MKAKIKLSLIILVLSGCLTSKRSKPCKDCPHFTKVSALFLEKVKLNPYPSQIVLQTKYDK
jgi:hypothetical protein